jgi:hypothetical protein
MAETFAEYLQRYGRPDGQHPVIDLDNSAPGSCAGTCRPQPRR